MTPTTASETRARRLLAFCSWTMVAVFASMFLFLIPPLERAAEVGHPLGPVVGGTAAVFILIGGFGSWAGGVWHAIVHSGFYTEGHRVTVIMLLVISNVLGSVFYYFGYVYWQHRIALRRAAV